MDNAEATPLAAGESVEITRRRSDKLEQPGTGCEAFREPASAKVINTPCETLFHQALIRARLSFETQSHPAGDRWEADIELHQKPIIIEVTNSPGEKRAKDRRERKTAALKAAGYHVYWFSNHQARTDPDRCVRQVMREHGLTAETDPVALIRRNRKGHVGAHNPNWGGGAAEVRCEQCGTSFEAHRRNGGKTARFCSSECYGKWMHEHPETVKSKRLERDWSQLAALYAAGMSSIQLAEHYGCSKRSILMKMRSLGIQPRPQGGPRVRGGLYQAGSLPGS
jgi:very-short-patch-repair endonuclease